MGMLIMGSIIDRFGTKIGYTIAILTWSIFGMLHAAVRPAFSLIGFMLARFGLGLGEAGNFPAAIKTVAEWFPKKERAFATGIFNAGANVGAILAPLTIPLIVMADGTNWQYAFLLTGIFSFTWVIVWLRVYKEPEKHPRLSKEELEYIQSDSSVETKDKISWIKLLSVKETWAFAAGKLTDAVWWFYLFWGGKFLFDKFGLNIKELAIPLIIIYVVADFGSIFGGWLSSHFIKIGWSINKARKTTLLISAIAVLPVMFVTTIPTSFKIDQQFFEALKSAKYKTTEVVETNGKLKNKKVETDFPKELIAPLQALEGNDYSSAKDLSDDVKELIGDEKANLLESTIHEKSRVNKLYWLAVIFIALAAAAHTSWAANIFTVASDIFPKKAVASVTGIGGMVGAVAGLLADYSLGQVLTSSGPSGYFFAFLISGAMYVIILGIVHVLSPKLTPLNENLKRTEH